MFKRIDHVEVIPSDFERSLEFYVAVLGFAVKSRIPVDTPPLQEVVYLSLGDTVLELLRVTDPAPADPARWRGGYRMMALEVDDLDEALEYLRGKGVQATWGPVTMGPTRRAEVTDPDGLPIEIRQW